MDIQSQQKKTSQTPPAISSSVEDEVVGLVLAKTPVLTHYSDNLCIADTLTRPSIQLLCKTHGSDYMGVCITAILTEFLSLVKNSIKAEEVPLYADKILSFKPNWSTADLALCLGNGINGKYGSSEYPWKWNPDFIDWARKYDQEKVDYFYQKHMKVKSQKHDDLIKMIPKHVLEKFTKEKFVNQEKRERLNVKIPKEIVDQGVEAVDAWIAQVKKSQAK